MDYVAIIYQGNNLVCYDGKEFEGGAKGNRVGEEVTIKTKNCFLISSIRRLTV